MCICPQNIQISPLATKILRWRHGQLQNSTEFLSEPDFPFRLSVFHTWPSKLCLRVEPLRAVFDIFSKSSTSSFALPMGREGEWNPRYCTRTKLIDPLLTLQSRCEPRRFRPNAKDYGSPRPLYSITLTEWDDIARSRTITIAIPSTACECGIDTADPHMVACSTEQCQRAASITHGNDCDGASS